MKLHLFWYECKNCKKIFKSPELCGDGYGEFLFFDESGNMTYLNSFTDSAFDEVTAIFRGIITEQERNNTSLYLKLFSPVLIATCDLSPTNQIYQMRKPFCPICKKINIGHFGPTNPPEFVQMEIPNATHHAWDQLSDNEKRSLVEKIIEETRKKTKKTLIGKVKSFIADLDAKKPPKDSFEILLRDQLQNYLVELEKPNNDERVKVVAKSFGSFYRNFYFENKGGLDWSDPLLIRCSEIMSLNLKNGL